MKTRCPIFGEWTDCNKCGVRQGCMHYKEEEKS